MHPQQKHARFNLIVTFSALLPAIIGFAVLYSQYGPKRATAAFGFLGILGLWGFGNRFYRTKRGGPSVLMDERDEDIKRRSLVIAWAVEWVFLASVCMLPWFFITYVYGLEGAQEPMQPVSRLPLIFIATAVVHTLAWSTSVLVLYGKGAADSAG